MKYTLINMGQGVILIKDLSIHHKHLSSRKIEEIQIIRGVK